MIIALALLVLALLILIILIDRITVRATRSVLGALKSARLAWCGVMGVLEVFEMSSKLEVSSSRFQQGEEFGHQAIGAGDKGQQRIDAEVESFVAEVASHVLKYIESERRGKTESCGIKLPETSAFKLYSCSDDPGSFLIRNNPLLLPYSDQVHWWKAVTIRFKLDKVADAYNCIFTMINHPQTNFLRSEHSLIKEKKITVSPVSTLLTPAQLKLARDNSNTPTPDQS